jgi:hypothetical protein
MEISHCTLINMYFYYVQLQIKIYLKQEIAFQLAKQKTVHQIQL